MREPAASPSVSFTHACFFATVTRQLLVLGPDSLILRARQNMTVKHSCGERPGGAEASPVARQVWSWDGGGNIRAAGAERAGKRRGAVSECTHTDHARDGPGETAHKATCGVQRA